MLEHLADRLDIPPGSEVQDCFSIEGADLHFRFLRGKHEASPLIVRFHGAIAPERRPLPVFQRNLPKFSDIAHQITICDPTLVAKDGFNLGWYAGHEGLDVQGIIRRFLEVLTQALTPSRTIYLGSSGGGFAALYFSYHDADSVAVVMVPQTIVGRGIYGAVQNYITSCWPGMTLEEVEEATCLDVTRLYSSGFENTVIYIQSQGDFKHTAKHLTPFMSACYNTGDPDRDKILIYSDYWGVPGHGGSVPPGAYTRWLRAALSSPTRGLADLLGTYSALQGDPLPTPEAPKRAPGFNSTRRDLETAEFIRAALMNRPEQIERDGEQF